MNNQEMVQYKEQVNKYISDVKLTDFFENLTRILVLSKPRDPVAFLIEVLEHRVVQRLILVHGIIQPKRNEIVQALGNTFNYKVISIEEILAEQIRQSHLRDIGWLPDSVINETVYENFKKIEKHHRGVIVSGYPSNLQQCLFLQQKGVIPERFFILNQSEEFCTQYYHTLYDHALRDQKVEFSQSDLLNYIDKAIKRDRLNKQEIGLAYGNFIDEFDLSLRPKEEIIENLKQIIKIRDRKQPPLRFPRVMIIRPPKLKERASTLLDLFSKRYGLKAVSCFQAIEEQITEQNEIGKYVQKSLVDSIPLPDDIVQCLIYTKLQSTEARTKGWILEGFPKNQIQLNAVENYKFSPNLILVLSEEEDILINKIKQLKVDPVTGKRYESIPVGDNAILGRLKQYKVADEQALRKEIQNYNLFIRKIEDLYGDRVQMFKLEKDSVENIIRITDVFLNNPKIYN